MKIIDWFNKYTGAFCLLLLFVLILVLPHVIIWDEQWYIECVGYIKEVGLNTRFIVADPAAPMHAIVHYMFSPITHLNSPQIRILNLIMCISISIYIYKGLKLTNYNVTHGYSLLVFLLPGFFVIGFFAITEAPCLMFYTFSVFFLMKYVLPEKQNLVYMLLSGFFLALTILTRQIFLVCIGPVCVMVFYVQFKNRFPAIILFVLSVLIFVTPVFYLWKGIVPSASVFRSATVSLFSMKYVFLSFGYAFFYFATIIPVYFFQFIRRNWKASIALAVIGFLGSFYIKYDSFLPMTALVSHMFSPTAIGVISFSFFKVVVMTGLILLFFLLAELYQYRKDFTQVFYVLSMLSILVTPALIFDQFSSRYPLQIAPILILFAYTRIKPINSKIQFGINWIAIGINIISVVTFFIY